MAYNPILFGHIRFTVTLTMVMEEGNSSALQLVLAMAMNTPQQLDNHVDFTKVVLT